MEVNGCGFPSAACAQLDVARAEFDAAHDELQAAIASISWVAPIAEEFRAAAGVQACEVATATELVRAAAAHLRWQGTYLAVDAWCG